jgi:glutathionyl-hydroquinone reductase
MVALRVEKKMLIIKFMTQNNVTFLSMLTAQNCHQMATKVIISNESDRITHLLESEFDQEENL